MLASRIEIKKTIIMKFKLAYQQNQNYFYKRLAKGVIGSS